MRTSAAELQHCHPGRKQSPQRCAEAGTNRRVQHPQERRGRRTMPHGLPVVVRSHTRLPHFALVLGLPVVTPRSPSTDCPFRSSPCTRKCRSVLRLARRDPMFSVCDMARPHGKAECREPGVSRTLLACRAWSVRLVVRVRAAGVVGDVDHLGDLGHGFEDHGFDALAQGGGSHPAALTPAAEV